MAKRFTDEQLRDHLGNWVKLHAVLKDFDLDTLERAVALERSGLNRAYILLRLHTRRQRLRSRAEWEQLVR